MGYRRHVIAPDEWYHCYTRGIDGRVTFSDPRDYDRFREALYIANSVKNISRSNIQHREYKDIFKVKRGDKLVTVGAYCIMPNHFHLLLKEDVEGGIVKFMQKIGTGYAMYFNTKYKRIGSLFVGPFRSRHIDGDQYLRRIVPYIHLNPVELFEPRWKDGVVSNMRALEQKLAEYPYSSFPDYMGSVRIEKRILNDYEHTELLSEKMPPIKALLHEMRDYYQNLP